MKYTEELKSYWDVTPEMMAQEMNVQVNPWQPSPDNPYFSSAAAAAANAAAAAVTNPHNKILWKNPANLTNMTVIAQKMSGAHSSQSLVNPLAAAAALTTAATNPLLTAMNNPLLRKRTEVESARDPVGSSVQANPIAALLSKMKQETGSVKQEGNIGALSGSSGAGGGGGSGGATMARDMPKSSIALEHEMQQAQAPTANLAEMVQQSNYLHQSRASRRIYVGNLPHTVTEEEIRQFFNATMIAAQGKSRTPGESVTNVYLNAQKRYVLCDMYSMHLRDRVYTVVCQ